MGERAPISPTCSVLLSRPLCKNRRVGFDWLTVVVKIRLERVLRGWTGELHNMNWVRKYSETIVTEAETKVRTVCVVHKVQAVWGQTDQSVARDVCLRCGDVETDLHSRLLCLRRTKHAVCGMLLQRKTMAKHLRGDWMAAKCLLWFVFLSFMSDLKLRSVTATLIVCILCVILRPVVSNTFYLCYHSCIRKHHPQHLGH